MNSACFLPCFVLLCLFPHACLAQKYYSDDGQYVAETEQVSQTTDQLDKYGIDANLYMYVHSVNDTTPFNKISPLRYDRLVCVFLGDVITGDKAFDPPNDRSQGTSVDGERSTISVGAGIGKVRTTLPSIDFTVSIAASPNWQYAHRIVAAGTSTADFGPLSYRIMATPDELSLNEGGARAYFPNLNGPQIRQMWPGAIYDDQALLATDAKGRKLYVTSGGAVTDGGNILERTANYSAHENWFSSKAELADGEIVALRHCNGPHGGSTIQIPLGYSMINYPITLSMPMAETWTLKTEHFHLTNIVMPSLTQF